MSQDYPFVATLREHAQACEAAEKEFRRTIALRVAELAKERAFANRRMNIMRSLLETVARFGKEEEAVEAARHNLRNRLGWRDSSDARDEVLDRYSSLAGSAFATVHTDGSSGNDETLSDAHLANSLAEFEEWYLNARGKPFWVLFEHYMPETQLVDF